MSVDIFYRRFVYILTSEICVFLDVAVQYDVYTHIQVLRIDTYVLAV